MKRLNSIILLFTLCLPMFAQQQAENDSIKRAKEREIKTSGLYLYGEAVHEKKSDAVKTAKLILTSEINKEILNHPNWQFAKKIEVKDVEYKTEHFDLPRGSKTRVIAFIKKDGIKAIFDETSPDIVLIDKTDKPEKSKEKEKEKKEKEKKETPTVIDQVYNTKKETVPTELPVIEEQETNIEQPETDIEEPEELSEEEQQPVIDELPEEDIQTLNEDIESVTTGNAVLDDLLTARNINDAATLLTKYKRTGKLAYGKPGTSLAIAQSYIMLYNNKGLITAILDKEKANSRINLLTGEETQFNSNAPYIWFQLFD